MALDPRFLDRPLAHRGLHDAARGLPENSRAAIGAAIQAGYGIEIDLQLSADGCAMVFHDNSLERLTGASGALRHRPARELAVLRLAGGNEGIPGFAEILALVGGQVPLLVEIKDQGGTGARRLEQAAAEAVAGYSGPLAFMSFDPLSMIALGAIAPHLARGLITCDFSPERWPGVPAEVLARLARIEDLEAAGASFISHHWRALGMPRVAEIKAMGLPVLCWTIRSAAEEQEARRIADNVTFEGYAAA